jgi:hypothetical protein
LAWIGFTVFVLSACAEQHGDQNAVTMEENGKTASETTSLNDFLSEEWNSGKHDDLLLILANVLTGDTVELKWEKLAMQRYIREEGRFPFILTRADSLLLSDMGVHILQENRFWVFEYEGQQLISIHDMSFYSKFERIAKKQSDTLIYAYFDKFTRNEVAVFMP